jgi:hypothetical protein
MVCEWYGLKTTRTVFAGLASKPVATVYSGLASKPVVTVSSDLVSKPVAMVFLQSGLKTAGNSFSWFGLYIGGWFLG